MAIWRLTVIAAAMSFFTFTRGQQCMGCDYTDIGTRAECMDLELTMVPVCLPPSTTALDLSINKISQLEATDFQHMPNVDDLDLTQNLLEMLPEDVFVYMRKLSFLDLSSNKLKDLPDNLFLGNPRISFLAATDNMITKLNQHTFQPLQKLSMLFLSDNLVRNIDYVDTFINNTQLEHFDMSRNELVTLHEEVFASQRNMEIWIVGNNWHCDCILTNLTAAFKRQRISFPLRYTPSCSTPSELYEEKWEFLDPLPCDS